jgi:metallo-beta-lactamase class B
MKARDAAFVTLLSLLSTLAAAQERPALRADAPVKCDSCDAWNAPREPFRLFGNSYFVGMQGLSAVLIASDQGLILLDGGLTQSAPLIDANIRKLGFRTEAVKLIVNSHAHFDHAGGIAALQRVSGATVAASPSGAFAIEHGGPPADDPQYAFGHEANDFPRVKRVRVVKDGETLRVGDLAITARLTPGHTPGSTTWTWRSCEGARCLDLVYADSLNSISAPGFRFTGDAKHPSREESFRASIAKVAALPCDIIVAVHPALADLEGKLKRRAEKPEAGSEPFVDPEGCRTYAAGARERLDQRLAEERRPP